MDLLEALDAEVARFRAWADTWPIEERTGEWECNYERWRELYNAFIAFVMATSHQQWNSTTAQTLLYVIARDNEIEALVKEVAKKPDDLVYLAQQAMASAEPDAKWQIAVELSRLEPQLPSVEPLLLQFAYDEDEYVRRRALMALADIKSSKALDLVKPAWGTGDEYQRMAVLAALAELNDPELAVYLTLAEADGRQYLVRFAERIRTSHS